MLRASDRSDSRRDTVMLLGCVAVSLLMLLLPDSAGQGVAGALRSTVLAPLVWLQTEAELGRTSRSRFQEVTAERDTAALAAQSLPVLRAENARLRQLLILSRRLPQGFVAAEVLHQSQASDGRMLLVNAGSARGIAPFQPVVAPEGLIGAVANVGPGSSTVMTWAHPDFRVSAFTEDGRVAGVVAPSLATTSSEAGLEFRAASYRDTLLPGTLVLSSGLGGVYPKGIPVGTVRGVAREQQGWERVYGLEPAARPGVAAHVMILTGADSTLNQAFPADSILAAVRDDSLAAAARADSLRTVRLADSVKAWLRDSLVRAARAAESAAVPAPAVTP